MLKLDLILIALTVTISGTLGGYSYGLHVQKQADVAAANALALKHKDREDKLLSDLQEAHKKTIIKYIPKYKVIHDAQDQCSNTDAPADILDSVR